MKVIVHDFFQTMGGAEKLVCTIARHFPEIKIITSKISSEFAREIPDLLDRVIVIESKFSFLGRIPNAILAFTSNKQLIKNSKTVIYSGVYSLIYSRNQKKGKRIFFCHTTPKFIFHGDDKFYRKYQILEKTILYFPIKIFKYFYVIAVNSMDYILTNSFHMKSKIKKQLNLNSEVIYAPIDTHNFKWINQKKYFFALGRLEKYKRVDKLILAFNEMEDKKLVIGSTGSDYKYLKNLAKKNNNICFTGWLTLDLLYKYIGEALACIYVPADEDFGMAAVESLAAGKPVIGVNEGGIKEIIEHKKNGILLNKNFSIREVINAVNEMTPQLARKLKKQCEKSSVQFSELTFISKIKHYVK